MGCLVEFYEKGINIPLFVFCFPALCIYQSWDYGFLSSMICVWICWILLNKIICTSDSVLVWLILQEQHLQHSNLYFETTIFDGFGMYQVTMGQEFLDMTFNETVWQRWLNVWWLIILCFNSSGLICILYAGDNDLCVIDVFSTAMFWQVLPFVEGTSLSMSSNW
jgi:hypothetical protein